MGLCKVVARIRLLLFIYRGPLFVLFLSSFQALKIFITLLNLNCIQNELLKVV